MSYRMRIQEYLKPPVEIEMPDGFYRFTWSEGNLACDCSRAQLVAEAHGEPDPDIPCGQGRYDVVFLGGDIDPEEPEPPEPGELIL